jgi:hypothetical protein
MISPMLSRLYELVEWHRTCAIRYTQYGVPEARNHPFVGVRSVTQEKESYMFLLGLPPMFPDLSCGPISLLGSRTGNANVPVQRQIDAVIACLKDARISVLS